MTWPAGIGRRIYCSTIMESPAGSEVNSDDEFIVPPMKRARTAVGGGKKLRVTIYDEPRVPTLS